ncbi:MAG TPA: DUF72 domain-containing protein, partial [Candidatus Kapabacteria bacterium]|nr:DUF72 domain-containing protein [Candidatus Kapabacteria bacterium]
PENTNRLFELLNSTNKGWVITDTSGRRDCLHMQNPVPRAFIRFVGNNMHKTDAQRVNDWAKRTKQWLTDGMHSVYFFIHQHDELYAPPLSQYAIKKFNEVCKLTIPVPVFVEEKNKGEKLL